MDVWRVFCCFGAALTLGASDRLQRDYIFNRQEQVDDQTIRGRGLPAHASSQEAGHGQLFQLGVEAEDGARCASLFVAAAAAEGKSADAQPIIIAGVVLANSCGQ